MADPHGAWLYLPGTLRLVFLRNLVRRWLPYLIAVLVPFSDDIRFNHLQDKKASSFRIMESYPDAQSEKP